MADRKVLIIDDDDALLPMLKTAFKRYKFDVHVTSDAAEGLEQARVLKPDLVLLSVELPTGNGFLVCKDFKQDAELKSIPVIITSRKASEADFEKHRKLKVRANDYLHKPFTDEELFAKVGNVVGFTVSADEFSELEAKVHDFLEDRTKLESEISEKADRIAELEAELAKAQKAGGKQVTEKDARIAELEAELEAAQAGGAAVEKLEKQLAKKEEEAQKFKAEADERKAEIKALKAENAAKVSALESELAEAQESAAAVAKLEAKLGDLEAGKQAAEARIKTLEGDLKRKESELADESKAAQGREKALEKQVAALRESVDAVVEAAGTSLEDLQENISAWREAALRLSALEEDNTRLENELQAARTHAAELEKSVEREGKKRAKLREVLEKAITTLD